MYVGTEETLVLPSWVVQDLAWTMGYLLMGKSKRRERTEELCGNNMIATTKPRTSYEYRKSEMQKENSNQDVHIYSHHKIAINMRYDSAKRAEKAKVCLNDTICFKQFWAKREARLGYSHEPGRKVACYAAAKTAR